MGIDEMLGSTVNTVAFGVISVKLLEQLNKSGQANLQPVKLRRAKTVKPKARKVVKRKVTKKKKK